MIKIKFISAFILPTVFFMNTVLCRENKVTSSSLTLAMSAAECVVWKREFDFAQTVENHDKKTFAEHIHKGAVFFNGKTAIRGREAILKDWQEILEGETTILRWRPSEVAIGSVTTMAVSKGPYVIETVDAQNKPLYLLGTFTSFWIKGKDRKWRIMYDSGSAPTKVENKEVLEKHLFSVTTACQ